MRVGFPRIAALLLLLLLAILADGWSAAQASGSDKTSHPVTDGETTIVVFGDRRMPEGLWPSLIAALREELEASLPETLVLRGEAAGGDVSVWFRMVLQGDEIGSSGLSPGRSITVILHGECTITPRPMPISPVGAIQPVTGALGWTFRDHGQIGPFVHVDCGNLGRMLATEAFGLRREERIRLMAHAIARVILHEWIHVVTQSPHHAIHGLMKEQFHYADLLAGLGRPKAPPRMTSGDGQ